MPNLIEKILEDSNVKKAQSYQTRQCYQPNRYDDILYEQSPSNDCSVKYLWNSCKK